MGRLREFLAALPAELPAAFEFRHATWFDDEVYEALRERGAALVRRRHRRFGRRWPACRRDRRLGLPATAPPATTTAADLAGWAERVRAQAWSEAFVFFKHEDEGKGPELAATFKELLARQG